jgi:hypothetical protein
LKSASKLLGDAHVTRLGALSPLSILWLAAWLPGAAGCFYMDGINREPRASVQVSTPGPHYRNETVTFSASKSDDPDGDTLYVSWRARLCNAARTDCDTTIFAERGDRPAEQPFVVTVRPDRDDGTPTGSIVVSATVRDTRHATHSVDMFVDVTNRSPAPVLQVQGYAAPSGGYPIGTTVRVVAQAQDPDGDQTTFKWLYQPASGSLAENVGWDRVSDTIYDLRADVTGEWRVEVTATDELGAESTSHASVFFQPDGPPCIAATDPPALPALPTPIDGGYIVERDGAPRRFAVLAVADDLDVYPPPPDETPDGRPSPQGTARFHWSIATPYTDGARAPIRGHALSGYVIDPGAYAPGDTLSLRVELEDRNGLDVNCDQDQPTCALSGDQTCLQRVTWRIEIR